MGIKILVALLLLAAGLALRPLENSIGAERARLKYGGPPVSIELREAIGQDLAIGLLAGMRGVVADFLWINSHDYWEKKEWLRQYRNIQIVATLQPQSVLFWDLGQWHMAWNIGYGVLTDPKNRTKAEGIKREREWHEKAREFIEQGIKNVPNRYDLYFTMGWLYYEKLSKDCEQPPCQEAFCQAADYFHKAAEFPEAPQFVPRFYARALEKCGRPDAAYEEWKRLWFLDHSKVQQSWNIIEREIRDLENQLRIPNDSRLFPPPLP